LSVDDALPQGEAGIFLPFGAAMLSVAAALVSATNAPVTCMRVIPYALNAEHGDCWWSLRKTNSILPCETEG